MEKNKWFGWVIAIVVIVAVLGILYKVSVKSRGTVSGTFYPEQSHEHIEPGATHDPYNSNPPSGGWHYATPAQSGIYDTEIADETVVHNLEHQQVWITYKPGAISQADIDKLAAIAMSYGSKIVMTPRAANDSPIALAAWEYVLKLDTIDEAQIRGFIDYHRGVTGRENVPDFGFADFRGKTTPTPSVSAMPQAK